MAAKMSTKISAASARSHTRKPKQKSSIPLPSGAKSFTSSFFFCYRRICRRFIGNNLFALPGICVHPTHPIPHLSESIGFVVVAVVIGDILINLPFILVITMPFT